MDPLSDALAVIDARAIVSSRLIAGGDWALAFDPLPGVKFNAVRRGRCWLRGPHAQPIRLETGDGFVLRDQPFVLASGPDVAPVDATTVFSQATDGVARCGTGDDVELLGGRLAMALDASTILLQRLPGLAVIPAAEQTGAIAGWLELLDIELRQPQAGADLAAASLMQLVFIAAFRALAERSSAGADPGLAFLRDGRISRVLSRLHQTPGEPWDVDRMARLAGLSRSSFTRVFRARLGVSPLDYLTRWRMRIAARALTTTERSLADIAQAVGYESVAGFTAAFRRVLAQSPASYRKGRADLARVRLRSSPVTTA